MQAASSNYAKRVFFFQEALGKRQVITPSFTLFEKEKSQQIIAKKKHTVLSTFSALVKIQVSWSLDLIQ